MFRKVRQEIPSLYAVLADIPDPRRAQGRRHPLGVMLSLACVALLSGRQTVLGIAEWAADYGESYLEWFQRGWRCPPSQATWYRVLRAVDWQELEARVHKWVQQVLGVLAEPGALRGMAIDGKTLRGSRKQGAANAHLLSAVGHQLGMTLIQVAVSDKTNEIGALEDLLRRLVIEGQVVTIGALLTQRHVAQAPVERKADYVFLVRDNQPSLCQDLQLLFTTPPPRTRNDTWPEACSCDLAHGRIEVRQLQATTALNDYLDWPGVAQVFRLVRQRHLKRSGSVTVETTYGVTSLPPQRASAAQLLALTRLHWTIENRSHWARDVAFDEDRAQTRRGRLPHVMATLRNLTITLLRANGLQHIARARRRFAARPEEALHLLGLPASE